MADEEELTHSELARRGGSGDTTQAAQQDQQDQRRLSSPETQSEDEAGSDNVDGAVVNNPSTLESPSP